MFVCRLNFSSYLCGMKTNDVIKLLIPFTGMSQTQVANSVGISKSQLSQYLGGNATANKEVLEKLLCLTGIHLDTYAKRAELATKVASALKAAGIDRLAVKDMPKKDMADKSGCPEVKCFFDVTEEQLQKALDSGLIECQTTYPYFKALVLVAMGMEDGKAGQLNSKDVNKSWEDIAKTAGLAAALPAVGAMLGPVLASGIAGVGVMLAGILGAQAIIKNGGLKGDSTASILELAKSLAKGK